MSEANLARIDTWLAEPMEEAVAAAIDRLRRAEDVRRIAVMPDVHLATDVCIGTVLATAQLLYPGAVGGDIGCGMLALAFEADADALANPARAATVLRDLHAAVPALRRHRARAASYPVELEGELLSHPALDAVKRGEGRLQLGTLGGGNHFVELQADDDNRLWLMIHSGSRALGQGVRCHHLARARSAGGGMKALDANTDPGQAYLHDVTWARRYADANRRTMAAGVISLLHRLLKAVPVEGSLITCDHNHVSRELHDGQLLWVHRKGAMPAGDGVPGVLPGSMGTASFHVEGRGCAASMNSSAHGAGRKLSRDRARQRISWRDLFRQMAGVWFDPRLAGSLRDEAPAAYKDIHTVLRAQHELVRVRRTLRPLLVYKSGK